MDAHRWQLLESVFQAVVELPQGESRDTRLVQLCAGDGSLETEVRALLDEDRFLHETVASDQYVGAHLGRYRIERLIARGGMAAVYEGFRADETFAQRVAIKVMDARLADPALVEQFRAERQILATLEHPSITRLIDGGMTSDGAPYLVMEFIDGQPIDRYCDERRLDLAARVRLVTDACDGVSFAHRSLVLHRDLKPSNILVTADGHAKVVDFGTATWLQPDRLATVSPSPLTPAYASPEQLLGQAVGTASDQYSVGLVLYQLITGVHAFGERTSLMASVERAMAGTEPKAGSATVTPDAAMARRTSPVRLKRQLSGDLGTIVTKALASDPAKRYASLQHLVDDLGRWSQGAPILGRPQSVAYRASRLVRRHWVASTAVAALSLALVGATVVSVWQAARARVASARAAEESARAIAEASKAQQLNRFLTNMLSSARPIAENPDSGRAKTVTVLEVLDRAEATIAKELGSTPEVEAEMRQTIGTSYVYMGAIGQGRPQLERALALYEASGNQLKAAYARVALSTALFDQGEFAAAEPVAREAATALRRLGGDIGSLASAINNLALALFRKNPNDREALALLGESLELSERAGDAPRLVITSAMNLGMRLLVVGDLPAAEAVLARGLRLADANPTARQERAWVLRVMSELERNRGRYDEAARLGAESVAIVTKQLPPGHVTTLTLQTTWGRALAYGSSPAQAVSVLREAEAGYSKIRPAGHFDFVGPRLGLGVAYRRLGRLRESERMLRDVQGRLPANAAALINNVAGELGLTLKELGKLDEAARLLATSHEGFKALYGDAHPYTVRAFARVQGARD